MIGLSSIDLFLDWLSFNKSEKVTDNSPHIDHLIPCSSFDLTKAKEQKKCFNWRNTRYMNEKDNLSKNSKYPEVVEIVIQDLLANVFKKIFVDNH